MNNRSVFLCDDDDGVRSSISFLLRQHGLRVVPYASGPELLSAFDQFKNPPRGIVILDVRMEPLSGLQVHEALVSRGMGDRMPVLFLSGHGIFPWPSALWPVGHSISWKNPANDALVQLIRSPGGGRAMARSHGTPRSLQDLMSSLSRQQVRLMPRLLPGSSIKRLPEDGLSIRTVEEHRRRFSIG
jgi:two-component system response regulator DctR